MADVVLTAQTGANASTALMEVLLLFITLLLGVIGWGARKAFQDLQDRLETANSRRTRNREDIDDHSYMLYGSDTDTWDGVYHEVKKNRRGIRQQREVLNQHGNRIEKHSAALRREEMIQPGRPDADARTAADLADLNRIGKQSGGDD